MCVMSDGMTCVCVCVLSDVMKVCVMFDGITCVCVV